MFGHSQQSLNNLLFWISRKKWLIATFFVSIIIFYLPTPEGLKPEAHRTLIIVITALILIISESIPIPAVAILILIMEVVLGVDSADGVASSFMSDAVFFIMVSLMLATAIVHQGLDKHIALLIFGVMLIVIGIQFFSIGLLGELIARSNQDNENRVKSKHDKI